MPNQQQECQERNQQQECQERVEPSIIITIGVVLLFIVGIILAIQAPFQPPTPPPDSITFENPTWPKGPSQNSEACTEIDYDPLVYRLVVTGTTTILHPSVHSEVLFEQGLCLTVEARVKEGVPSVYGVSFHVLSKNDWLRLSISEQRKEALLEQVSSTSTKAITAPDDISYALSNADPDGWHLIHMAIRPERVDVWLNGCPILAFNGENLPGGNVGVFVVSGTEEDALPTEVDFRNFGATHFSLECLP